MALRATELVEEPQSSHRGGVEPGPRGRSQKAGEGDKVPEVLCGDFRIRNSIIIRGGGIWVGGRLQKG